MSVSFSQEIIKTHFNITIKNYKTHTKKTSLGWVFCPAWYKAAAPFKRFFDISPSSYSNLLVYSPFLVGIHALPSDDKKKVGFLTGPPDFSCPRAIKKEERGRGRVVCQ